MLSQPMVTHNHDVECAAWIIEDALIGHFAERYPHGPEAKRIRVKADILHYLRMGFFYAIVTLMMLMLFECPLWCSNHHFEDTVGFGYQCHLSDGSTPETFGLPIIPVKYSMLIEGLCMAYVTWVLAYEMKLHADVRLASCYGSDSLALLAATKPGPFLVIMCIMWVDLTLFAVLRNGLRVSQLCRLLLLFYWPRTRETFHTAQTSLQNLTNILVFLLTTIAFFAWVTIMVFRDLETKDTSPKDVGADGFKTFTGSMLTYFTMMTGSTFPDAMDAAVQKSRWMVGIFYSFMIITFFLFMKMMLAIVYNSYRENAKLRMKDFYHQRCRGLVRAYSLLASPNPQGVYTIDFQAFANLIAALQEFPMFRGNLSTKNTKIVFKVLDQDRDNQLILPEFFEACEILQYSFKTIYEKSYLIRECGLQLCWVHNLISSGLLEKAINCILIVNTLFMVIESYYDIALRYEPPWVKPLETFFATIYVVDVLLKLSVMSFPNYWGLNSNRFDFVMSILLFLTEVATLLPFVTSWRKLVTYFNLLRALRLVRLIGRIRRYQMIVECMINLSLVCGDMILMLGVTTYFFAIIGHMLFGGKLYASNPKLAGTDYLNEGYSLWNFNDMAGSVLTVFNMFVCTYQPEFVTVLDRVSSVPQAGPIYCITVFFVGVNICFNIFTAFTIDIFVSLADSQGVDLTGREQNNLLELRAELRSQGRILQMSMPPEVRRLHALSGIIAGLHEDIKQAQEEASHELHQPPRKSRSFDV